MVLKDAVFNGPKPTSVAARLNVQFTSNRRFEGGLYVGKLNAIGYGRLFRSGYHEAGEAP